MREKIRLTEEQTAVVKHKDGPAFVVAGAGTGKTSTMTERIGQMVTSGICPSNILVLTFTNAAANDMRQKLHKKIGAMTDEITAGTFHSFCNILMRTYNVPGRYFTILDGNDDEDLIKLVKTQSIYADTRFPRPGTLQSIFSTYINCRKPISDIIRSQYPKYGPLHNEIVDFYHILTKYKRDHLLVNYDNMLLYGLEILKGEHADDIRKEYQYILVDEAQDTNPLQFDITDQLSENIMFIGDPEQSIYGFRGSDMRLYLDVPSRHPGTKIYTLSNNYRCTQEILDVANSVIQDDDIPYKAILKTGKDFHASKPVLCCPYDQDEEAQQILQDIMQTNKKESYAVIYRNSATSAKLELCLVSNGIEYQKQGGIKFFERDCIRDMIALMRLLVNPHDYLSWFRILQLNRMIGEKRAHMIIGDGEDPIQDNPFRKQKTKTAKTICSQLDILEKALIEASTCEYHLQLKVLEAYYYDLRQTNYDLMVHGKRVSEDTLDAEEASIKSAKVYVPILLNMMEDFNSIRDFLDGIILADMPVVPQMSYTTGPSETEINTPAAKDVPDQIILTTVHSAKGLEWDHVAIMDAVQGIFPRIPDCGLGYSEECKQAIEEERRCMYVSITRARKDLKIYCPENASLYGHWYPGEISMFLENAFDEELLIEV